MMAIIVTHTAISVQAAKTNTTLSKQGFDCRKPTTLQTFTLASLCKQQNNTVELGPVDVGIYQQIRGRETTAYRCTRHESHFIMYCGSYSHMKLTISPTIENIVEVPINECSRTVKTQNYILPNGKALAIDLNTKTFYRYLAHGSLDWQTDNLYCQGADIVWEGERHQSALVFVSGHFELRNVKIEEQETKLMDLDSNTKLPSNCNQNNCITDVGTYVFETESEFCKYQKIRHLTMMMVKLGTKTYFVNHEHKLFLYKGTPMDIPTHCNKQGSFFSTQIKDLVVATEDVHPLMTVQSSNVDIDLELRASLEYLSYYTEYVVRHQVLDFSTKICKIMMESNTQIERSPFRRNHLFRRRGDLVQELRCEEKQVYFTLGVALLPECYRHGLPGKVDGTTVLFHTQSHTIWNVIDLTVTPCVNHYADYVITNEKIIIYSDPVCRAERDLVISDPPSLFSNAPVDHEKSGFLLYTQDEIIKMNNLIHFSRVKDQLTETMVENICANEERTCGYGTETKGPILSFSNILPNLPTILPWDIWCKHLLTTGSVGGLLCILICLIKVILLMIQYLSQHVRTQRQAPLEINIQPTAVIPDHLPQRSEETQPSKRVRFK